MDAPPLPNKSAAAVSLMEHNKRIIERDGEGGARACFNYLRIALSNTKVFDSIAAGFPGITADDIEAVLNDSCFDKARYQEEEEDSDINFILEAIHKYLGPLCEVVVMTEDGGIPIYPKKQRN